MHACAISLIMVFELCSTLKMHSLLKNASRNLSNPFGSWLKARDRYESKTQLSLSTCDLWSRICAHNGNFKGFKRSSRVVIVV